jgi:hypothetical protein
MSQTIENTENKEDKAEVKPLQLSSSNVVIAKPYEIEQSITKDTFDAMFNDIPKNARFSGSAQGNSLVADMAEPFDVEVVFPLVMNQKVTEITTLREGQKALPSVIATNKIAVLAHQSGKVVPSNILVTPENKDKVFKLIKNAKAKAITTHWTNRDGSPLMTSGQNSRVVAKLELYSDDTTVQATALEAEISEKK